MNRQKLKSFVPSFIKKHFSNQNISNQSKKQQNNILSIIQSDTLGMTIVQDDENNIHQQYNINNNNNNNNNNKNSKSQIQVLTPQEWVMIMHNGNLKGYSFSRIYYSFLKGIPDYLRFKIWLFFCSENSSKKFKFSVKVLPKTLLQKQAHEQNSEDFIQISQFTTELYVKLIELQPLEKQFVQIQKDVHRTYSKRIQHKYTQPLLQKILIALSNSGIQYSQGMNYILLNVMIYSLQSIGITSEQLFKSINLSIQKDIFIIVREIVIRMQTVFGNNNIFKVINQLEQKIAQSVPEVLYLIYKLGMDCFSMFSQYYFSLFSYNNPPDELCKQMMDLFFVIGEKAIHAIIVRMIQVSKDEIIKIKTAEHLNQFLKIDLFLKYYEMLLEQKKTAKNLEDFGLSFYHNI